MSLTVSANTFLYVLCMCQAQMIFFVSPSPNTAFHALKQLSASSDMNHDGEITLLLPLMAAKKDIKDIASSLLESIQATGIPSPY